MNRSLFALPPLESILTVQHLVFLKISLELCGPLQLFCIIDGPGAVDLVLLLLYYVDVLFLTGTELERMKFVTDMHLARTDGLWILCRNFHGRPHVEVLLAGHHLSLLDNVIVVLMELHFATTVTATNTTATLAHLTSRSPATTTTTRV